MIPELVHPTEPDSIAGYLETMEESRRLRSLAFSLRGSDMAEAVSLWLRHKSLRSEARMILGAGDPESREDDLGNSCVFDAVLLSNPDRRESGSLSLLGDGGSR